MQQLKMEKIIQFSPIWDNYVPNLFLLIVFLMSSIIAHVLVVRSSPVI